MNSSVYIKVSANNFQNGACYGSEETDLEDRAPTILWGHQTDPNPLKGNSAVNTYAAGADLYQRELDRASKLF